MPAQDFMQNSSFDSDEFPWSWYSSLFPQSSGSLSLGGNGEDSLTTASPPTDISNNGIEPMIVRVVGNDLDEEHSASETFTDSNLNASQLEDPPASTASPATASPASDFMQFSSFDSDKFPGSWDLFLQSPGSLSLGGDGKDLLTTASPPADISNNGIEFMIVRVAGNDLDEEHSANETFTSKDPPASIASMVYVSPLSTSCLIL
ncbi:hypothetical protein GYMLUDRAFT_85868, partial [Collybiopsis luxurians FD-317 M1]